MGVIKDILVGELMLAVFSSALQVLDLPCLHPRDRAAEKLFQASPRVARLGSQSCHDGEQVIAVLLASDSTVSEIWRCTRASRYRLELRAEGAKLATDVLDMEVPRCETRRRCVDLGCVLEEAADEFNKLEDIPHQGYGCQGLYGFQRTR